MPGSIGIINAAGGLGGIRPDTLVRSPGAEMPGAPSFRDLLMKKIEQVNQLQQDAQASIDDLASGRRDDVDGVMIAKHKADLAFKMLLHVRNQMMEAYEEIKQMRV